MVTFPPCDNDGLTAAVPDKMLDKKLAKKGNATAVYWLIKWNPGSIENATWELAEDFCKRFPKFLD